MLYVSLDRWPIGLDFGAIVYRILGANKIKEAWKILKRQFGV